MGIQVALEVGPGSVQAAFRADRRPDRRFSAGAALSVVLVGDEHGRQAIPIHGGVVGGIQIKWHYRWL